MDLVGKHGRVRTIPMPTWVKGAMLGPRQPGSSEGSVLRRVDWGYPVQGSGMSEKVVWQLLEQYAAAGVPGIAPQDLRRNCAKLCGPRAANWSRSNCCSACLTATDTRDINPESVDDAAVTAPNHVFLARATEYAAKLRQPQRLAVVLAKLREAPGALRRRAGLPTAPFRVVLSSPED